MHYGSHGLTGSDREQRDQFRIVTGSVSTSGARAPRCGLYRKTNTDGRWNKAGHGWVAV